MTLIRDFSFRMVVLAALTGISCSAADIYKFALLPADGIISGSAGSTIGWGYSLTNESSTEWLVTTGLSSDPFIASQSAPLFDFPDLAPGAQIVRTFGLQAFTGLWALKWDNNAPDDLANFGTFRLDAEWWSGDPNSTGLYLTDAPETQVDYYAFVEESVPEPSSLVLVSFGLGLFVATLLICTRFHKSA